MPSNIIMADKAGGVVLTKIYETDVTESTARVTVPVTDAVANCKSLYFIHRGVSLSASDWLSFFINGYKLYKSTKSQTPADGDVRVSVSDPVEINGVSYVGRLPSYGAGVQSGVQTVIPDGITSIQIGAYTSGVTIEAGHFEVWGWL